MNTHSKQYIELIEQYGLNDENNTVELYQYDAEKQENILVPFKIFEEHEKGISILPFTLQRTPFKAKNNSESRWSAKTYKIIRLHPEEVNAKGEVKKYHIPAKSGTPPFIPVQLLKAYEAKQEIHTLFITEGYKKAFKACNVGLYTVGLISITCMIDKDTNKMHADIARIIGTCKVKRVVWLVDADFRDISKKEIDDKIDLAKRPNVFYNTVIKFHNLLSGIKDISLFFAHINADLMGEPKGLDDLLISHNAADVITDAANFDTVFEQKFISKFFTKIDITNSAHYVKKYFWLDDVTTFYLKHLEKRPELKGQEFNFFGTLYLYNEDQGKCEIKVPADAANYFRVGDDYYEYIHRPNRYGEVVKTYELRSKTTIRDDHGKFIFEHIPKFKAFCNVPDHLNYQRVINSCYNTYREFTHTPAEGDYEETINFFKHIFGTKEIEISNGKKIPYYELGLDYIQILLKHPQQILPILCLVSKERQTGKTTFAKWLKLLFTENMAIVGNQDFENSFNAHWITKLLVCVDETKIDKEYVVEKIKSLSTSNNTMLNAKGKNQVEVETFLKFILLSNNEDNFINIDKEEIRFWVLQVPTITERKLDLEIQLLDEIPAFLHFLNKRELVTQYEERHWFKTTYLQTDILAKIKENSAPTAWKSLQYALKELFMDFPQYDEFRIPLNEL